MSRLDIAVVAEDSLGDLNVRLVGRQVLGQSEHVGDWRDRIPFRPPNPSGKFGSQRRFQGLGLGGDGLIVRKVVGAIEPQPDIVIVARDLDRAPDRQESVRKGAATFAGTVGVVIAGMEPEAEARRICAFVPQTPNEHRRHQEVISALAFDPVKDPTRMSSTSRAKPQRDVKTAHAQLFDDDPERSHGSLARPLAELRSVAATCGLPSFIDEFETAVATAGAKRSTE